MLAARQDAVDPLRQDLLATGEAAFQSTGTLRGSLYTAALMHGIGRLVLLHAAAAAGADDSAVDAVYGTHGAALGMILLVRWGFNDEVAQAVGYQDHPGQLPEPGATLAAQVRACREAALKG